MIVGVWGLAIVNSSLANESAQNLVTANNDAYLDENSEVGNSALGEDDHFSLKDVESDSVDYDLFPD